MGNDPPLLSPNRTDPQPAPEGASGRTPTIPSGSVGDRIYITLYTYSPLPPVVNQNVH